MVSGPARWSTLVSSPAALVVGVTAIGLATTGLQAARTDWRLVLLAAGFAAAVTTAALAVPWQRLPAPAVLVLPAMCDLVIALLRHAQGGSTSGYSPLAILPVVWVGLTQRRLATAAMSVCTAATFAVPIVAFGAPLYPSSGWRAVILWLTVSGVVGVAANRVVASERHHASVAGARQRELRRLVETQSTIANTELDLDAALALVAEEARALTGAEGVVVGLPEGDEIVYRAAAGTASAHLGSRLRIGSTLFDPSTRTATTLVCTDTETDPRVDLETYRRIGARSLVAVPLLADGEATGVLEIYSSTANAFTTEVAELLTALANIIGTVLARTDLLGRLREQAVTDELTGLRNRRAWYEQLELAFARSRRSGNSLSVIELDVDGLKEVNDRGGHAAGDSLLIEIAGRWSSALRPTDILARIGGDEFAVLLEGVGPTAAADIAIRLHRALGDTHSASAGIATWDGQEQPDELMQRADTEMYRHKSARRGRRLGPSPEGPPGEAVLIRLRPR